MTVQLTSISALKAWRAALAPNASVGFVPTMGALHEGHLSLLALARQQNAVTIASIFVNPLQFGPNEDLASYPRPLAHDLALLEAAGVDAVFLPSAEELYPAGASTYVSEEQVSGPLCGSFRPGHFRGVTTVVLKLFNLVRPTRAYFGQKDAQQCAVLERMVTDLNVEITIVRGPTVREPDGLALSSRNAYLTPENRALAPKIHASMQAARQALLAGQTDTAALIATGRAVLDQTPEFTVQYWEIVDRQSLESLTTAEPGRAMIIVATYLGKTRLIDNLLL